MAVNNLNNFISSVTGRVLCDTNKVLVGDDNGVAVPMDDFPIDVPLPNIAFVFNSGSTETRQELTNAQFINDLGTGIAKIIENGLIAIAVQGVDYVDQPTVDAAEPEVQESVDNAKTQAGASLDSSIEAGLAQVTIIDPAIAYIATLPAVIELLGAQVTAAGLAATEAATFAYAASLAATATEYTADLTGVEADKAQTYASEANGAALNAKNSADASTSLAQEAYDAAQIIYGLRNKTLNEFPNAGDVNINNYRITNLKQSPEGDFDAVSFTFLWDLFNNKVEIETL